MATSLGEGIGLQSGHRNDYWMRRLADDQRIEDARNAQADRDLVKSTDFSFDAGKYLPYYANQRVQEQVKIMNDIAKMRQRGRVSTGQMQQRILQSQGRIAEIEMSNEAAKRYVEDKTIIKDDRLVSAFMSNATTAEELAKYNRGKFLQIGPQGQFAYQGVKNTTVPVKFDTNLDYTKGVPTGQRKRVGDVDYQETTSTLNPNAFEREVAQVATNEDFIAQTLYDAQGNSPTPLTDEEMVAVIGNRARSTVEKQTPKMSTEWKPHGVYHPPASQQKISSPLIENGEATIRKPVRGSDGKIQMKDGAAVFEDATMQIPLQQAVKVDRPQTIQVNTEMIDAETNKRLTGSGTIDFRPSSIVVVPVKGKSGKTEFKQYALGSVVRNVGGGEQDVTRGEMANLLGEKPGSDKAQNEKVFKIMVALDDVRSMVSEKNDISAFDKRFTELGKPVSTKKPAETKKQFATVTTEADYNKLKSGEKYLFEGKEYTKE